MEQDQKELGKVLSGIADQMRRILSNLWLAIDQLAPGEARDQDPALDRKAALLDQSYYQLLRLMNNLAMAACLTEDYRLTLKNQDLVKVVGEWSAGIASAASIAGVELRFVCAKDQLVCAVDPVVLQLILDNLASNALKFTPAGGTIIVELKEAADRVILQVTDTGRGIPQERMETLFDRYLHSNQLDPQVHGLGLGLPLCRRLAELQEGTLMADSKVGQGSRFTLSLPLRQVQGSVSDVPIDSVGGFNPFLRALADGLPANAFLRTNQD